MSSVISRPAFRHWLWPCLLSILSLLIVPAALAATPSLPESGQFPVTKVLIQDEKSVFATVESLKVIPARVRISGTVAEIQVEEGDLVEGGQVIGNVGDEKLALQILSLESRITGLEAQRAQAGKDLKRIEQLLPSGAVSQAGFDTARTAFEVADNALKAATAERDVIRRQLGEGAVLAPVSGRVLNVPITAGTVVMPGEVLAVVAEEDYVLRLEIPERHAGYMKVGDPVRIDSAELGTGVAIEGKITRIYPQIKEGRVFADARVEGLGNYFVGQRIGVWIPAGVREALVIPPEFIVTRGGIDFVRLMAPGGETMEVAVQRGHSTSQGVEILSGLREGDNLKLPSP